MNREIKFRYWDGKKMESDLDFLTPPFASWEELFEEYKSLGWVIMQYTGLKDKSGTDVYEGDILQWTENNNFLAGNIVEVKIEVDGVFPFNTSPATYWEVIGNVYESPTVLDK